MKIDVIVTSYNYENYIKETLDSLVNQTYKDFEVIIVDDGSKDNSVAIINDYVNKYPNFHLYTHPDNQNKGLIKSLKLGISKSSADYIVFLESDDYFAPNYMEEKVKYIKEHPDCVILINDISLVLDDNISDINRYYKHKYVNDIRKYYAEKKHGKNDFESFYSGNNLSTFSEVMIKADVLKGLDFNSKIEAWIDWWLWRQVALIYPIHFIDKKLTFWRIHDYSYIERIKRKVNNNKQNFIRASDMLLLKKYPKYKKYIILSFIKHNIRKTTRIIFSIHNDDDEIHKVIEIMGIKIKFKRKPKTVPQTRMEAERK